MLSLDTCAAGVATQRTHVQALLMLLFVNSCCLKRGATTLLFLNTVNLKNKLSKQQVGEHQNLSKQKSQSKKDPNASERSSKGQGTFGSGDSYECFE